MIPVRPVTFVFISCGPQNHKSARGKSTEAAHRPCGRSVGETPPFQVLETAGTAPLTPAGNSIQTVSRR
jgi:hypothetical protein